MTGTGNASESESARSIRSREALPARVKKITLRGLWFVFGAATVAVITFLVNENLTAVRDATRAPKQYPAVSVEVTVPDTDANSLVMLVRDPSRLPDLPPTTDCEQLYQAGKAAGGTADVDSAVRNILLTGTSDEGIVIQGLTARMTQRAPAEDGVLLVCQTQGEVRSIGYTFNLNKGSAASAMKKDEKTGKLEDDFAAGTVVTVRRGQDPVPLHVVVYGPDDSISWRLEAELVGRAEPLVIDDHGHEFMTAGRRSINGYTAGYVQGYFSETMHGLIRWGVETGTRLIGTGQEQRLVLGSVGVPARKGLDFYLGYPTWGITFNLDQDIIQPHLIRLDSRPLVSYAPTADLGFPVKGDNCGSPDWSTKGSIVASQVTQRELIRSDGSAAILHTVTKYTCVRAVGDDVFLEFLETWSTSTADGKADPNGTTFWLWQESLTQSDLSSAQEIMRSLTVAP